MGNIPEKQTKILEINSNDIDNNAISLSHLNEQGKTTLLSLNINNKHEVKEKFNRKNKIDFSNLEVFLGSNNVDQCLESMEIDHSQYHNYFIKEFNKLNNMFNHSDVFLEHPEFKDGLKSYTLNKSIIKSHFLEDKCLHNKLEDSMLINSISKKPNNKINKIKDTKKIISSQLKLKDNINEDMFLLSKHQQELERELLNASDPEFNNNLNMLIHKYESVSF